MNRRLFRSPPTTTCSGEWVDKIPIEVNYATLDNVEYEPGSQVEPLLTRLSIFSFIYFSHLFLNTLKNQKKLQLLKDMQFSLNLLPELHILCLLDHNYNKIITLNLQ